MEAIHCNLIGILGKMFYEELQDGPWFVEDGRIFFFYEKMTDCVITLHPQWRKHQFVSKAHMKKNLFFQKESFFLHSWKVYHHYYSNSHQKKKRTTSSQPSILFFFTFLNYFLTRIDGARKSAKHLIIVCKPQPTNRSNGKKMQYWQLRHWCVICTYLKGTWNMLTFLCLPNYMYMIMKMLPRNSK